MKQMRGCDAGPVASVDEGCVQVTVYSPRAGDNLRHLFTNVQFRLMLGKV